MFSISSWGSYTKYIFSGNGPFYLDHWTIGMILIIHGDYIPSWIYGSIVAPV